MLIGMASIKDRRESKLQSREDSPPSQRLYPIRYVVRTKHISIDVSEEISTDPRCLWSEAYFCTSCGKLWARIYGIKDWIIRIKLCPDCGDGSLLDWGSQSIDYYLDEMPIELLKYEVMIWQP